MVKSIGSSLLIPDSNFFGTILNSVKKTQSESSFSFTTYIQFVSVTFQTTYVVMVIPLNQRLKNFICKRFVDLF